MGLTMRIVIDSLIALMLVGVLVGVLVMHHNRQQSERDVAAVCSALDRLQEQAAYHTAVQSAMVGHDTMLVHLHEEWFGQDLPTNVLVGQAHPWIDLAPPGDRGQHPPDPVATEQGQAGFWYNPTTGTFRARVTPCSSEAETLALYNQINGTSLAAFEQMPDPSRRPIAHVLGSVPAQQYASLANQTWAAPKPDADEDDEPLYVSPTQADLDAEAPVPAAIVDSADRPRPGLHPTTLTDAAAIAADIDDAFEPDSAFDAAFEPQPEPATPAGSSPTTTSARPTLE